MAKKVDFGANVPADDTLKGSKRLTPALLREWQLGKREFSCVMRVVEGRVENDHFFFFETDVQRDNRLAILEQGCVGYVFTYDPEKVDVQNMDFPTPRLANGTAGCYGKIEVYKLEVPLATRAEVKDWYDLYEMHLERFREFEPSKVYTQDVEIEPNRVIVERRPHTETSDGVKIIRPSNVYLSHSKQKNPMTGKMDIVNKMSQLHTLDYVMTMDEFVEEFGDVPYVTDMFVENVSREDAERLGMKPTYLRLLY